MAAAPVNLDQGPPLPPNLQPQQQPSAQQLAGPQGQSATPNGSASLQQAIIQKAMFIEQTMNDMANIMPSLSGPFSGFIDQFRKIVGGALAKGAQPPGTSGPMGMGASQLLMPGGAPTS